MKHLGAAEMPWPPNHVLPDDREQMSNHQDFKGAVCRFGEEILIRGVNHCVILCLNKLSPFSFLNKLRKQTDSFMLFCVV